MELLFLLALSEANQFAAASIEKVWKVFCGAAVKYKETHRKTPVLIIDGADDIVYRDDLEQIQGFAKKPLMKGLPMLCF